MSTESKTTKVVDNNPVPDDVDLQKRQELQDKSHRLHNLYCQIHTAMQNGDREAGKRKVRKAEDGLAIYRWARRLNEIRPQVVGRCSELGYDEHGAACEELQFGQNICSGLSAMGDGLTAGIKKMQRHADSYSSLFAEDLEPPENDPPGLGFTTTSAADVSWHDVQARLIRLCDAGEAYTSQRELADRLGCSESTVNKAINESAKLKGWMLRHAKPRIPKAQSLDKVVTDNTLSRREADPATTDLPDDEVDRVMGVLIEQAEPAERAELNELNDEGRRKMTRLYLEQQSDQYIEDKAAKGNVILGRKP